MCGLYQCAQSFLSSMSCCFFLGFFFLFKAPGLKESWSKSGRSSHLSHTSLFLSPRRLASLSPPPRFPLLTTVSILSCTFCPIAASVSPQRWLGGQEMMGVFGACEAGEVESVWHARAKTLSPLQCLLMELWGLRDMKVDDVKCTWRSACVCVCVRNGFREALVSSCRCAWGWY